MEQFLVKTKTKPCAVNFVLTTDGSQVPIFIVGYDTINANTLYFRSRFLITGKEEVTLNCPQSPHRLGILVWSENNLPFKIASIDILPFERVISDDPAVRWIEYFSRLAGRLRPGNYVGDNIPFALEYKRNIYTDEGEVHPTPARIHVELPIIQVSKSKFDLMTIPERIIILFHEYAHNFINANQDDEIEADDNALDIYIYQLGYPKTEAISAFGNIMSDTENNIDRMINLVNMPA